MSKKPYWKLHPEYWDTPCPKCKGMFKGTHGLNVHMQAAHKAAVTETKECNEKCRYAGNYCLTHSPQPEKCNCPDFPNRKGWKGHNAYCPLWDNPKSSEGWEVEFEKEWHLHLDDWMKKGIKSFIHKTIEEQKQKSYDEGYTEGYEQCKLIEG